MTNDIESTQEPTLETNSEEQPLLSEQEQPRVYNKQIPWWILTKILILTFLLFTLPIFTYFYTEKHIFHDEPIYAALCAIAAANGVLILYLIVAALSDVSEIREENKAKKLEEEKEKEKEKKDEEEKKND